MSNGHRMPVAKKRKIALVISSLLYESAYDLRSSIEVSTPILIRDTIENDKDRDIDGGYQYNGKQISHG